ncbi:MAG TPA: DEAD/DEAH box helicase [Actinomycetales bacterium]|nr:DEAD/DEAH box helicase [Actinomycetales bacterium]
MTVRDSTIVRVDPSTLVRHLLAAPGRAERVLHVHEVSARPGRVAKWPEWAAPAVVSGFRRAGIQAPWEHQVLAAEQAWQGRHVAISTGTASGKSLAYLLPALSTVLGGVPPWLAGRPQPVRGATVLYLSPTKALAADQLTALSSLGLPGLRAATYDGDTPAEERRWVRDHASYVLTNPDLLHHSLLPGHARWASFLRGLTYVVVDEGHHYRGVFGSHVAAVLRRLRRVAARYGASPVFVLASATASDPGATASRLTGLPFEVVDDDTSRRGPAHFLLWEPPLLPGGGENAAPTRRSVTAETADLLADLVSSGVRTLAFVRSRRGAEAVALTARRLLAEVDDDLPAGVAAYRSGYLPEERRELESALRSGRLLALSTTNALELGVDVSGLDAVVMAGWPGTRASLWQQAGRAGRGGDAALAVLVARDDPLDTYLVHHPAAVFGKPVEATVLDPENPYVLAPHLCAAAAELPLKDSELPMFGDATAELLDVLVGRGLLRRRPAGWFWTASGRASDLTDLRGVGGAQVRVVEVATGRVLGSVDEPSAHHTAHDGAVYLHQGESYVVEELDLTDHVALVRRDDVDFSTQAREVTDIQILEDRRCQVWGDVGLHFGMVEVTSQVTSFLRREVMTGTVLGEEPLDLPARRLRTAAVWWTLPDGLLARFRVEAADVPGSAHAAEHAAIGLLPLVATCDRWDVGGVSTALHPDTGMPTIFVHDGHPGGAGFAERGFHAARTWLQATLEAISSCECDSGCPSCVQSPKCGNGNEPLDKGGAVRLLRATLAGAPAERNQQDETGSDR